MKTFDGHFKLFYDIINKNTPKTYANLREAGAAVKEYFRRFHEIINKAARIEKERRDKNLDEDLHEDLDED